MLLQVYSRVAIDKMASNYQLAQFTILSHPTSYL